MKIPMTRLQESFERLTRNKDRYLVWSDLMTLWASAISNVCDQQHFRERENSYMKVISHYTLEESLLIKEMYFDYVSAADLKPGSDVLGELYMELGLGNKHNGQFFSPQSIGTILSRITSSRIPAIIEKNHYATAYDCACGAGSLLLALADDLHNQGIAYEERVLFVAQDISLTAAMMAYIQLSMNTCPGYVIVGNTLTNRTEQYDHWFTPFFFTDTWRWHHAFTILKEGVAPHQDWVNLRGGTQVCNAR